MKSKYFLAFIFLLLVGTISASTMPVYKRCSEIDISHPIRLDEFPDANILCNITTFLPDNTISTNFKIMTNNYNQHNYTINSTQTCILGRHTYDITCTNGAANKTESFELEITESGMEKIGSGEGLTLVISIIVILSIAIFFFFISFKFEKLPGKFICIGLSSIIFLIAILYSLTILTRTFGGFSSLTEGYTTFWFVMRIIIGVVITFVCIYCLFLIIKLWNIKRGFVDED